MSERYQRSNGCSAWHWCQMVHNNNQQWAKSSLLHNTHRNVGITVGTSQIIIEWYHFPLDLNLRSFVWRRYFCLNSTKPWIYTTSVLQFVHFPGHQLWLIVQCLYLLLTILVFPRRLRCHQCDSSPHFHTSSQVYAFCYTMWMCSNNDLGV